MGKLRREMETLRKNQKEMVVIKTNIVTERKNAFDGLISRLDTAEGKKKSVKDISIESSA